jgi:MFS family permease
LSSAPSRPGLLSRPRISVPPFDRNGRLVLLGKAARTFGFGLLSVGIGLHLASVGLSAPTIGLILGGALLGTMLLTLLIAILGDRVGRRRFLVVGSLLMMLAAFMPLAGDAPLVLALIAATGAVAATANESSGLISADQAILPQTVPEDRRTDAFAVYSLVAFGASALGSASLAPLVWLADAAGVEASLRYSPAFIAYAAAGLLSALSAWGIDAGAEVRAADRVQGFGIVRSRRVVAEISLLFAFDSFATGLIIHGFLAFWFASVHGFGPGEISALFFITAILGAVSFPVAARLAARFGLIATMVFTNIPANLLLVAMALVPSGPVGTPVAVAFYMIRSLLASMDQPVRQSYVMAVVDPSERTATAAVTSLVRSGAQTAGPFMAGTLLLPIGLGVPVLVSGVLKIAYDVLLWRAFKARPAPEERAAREAVLAHEGTGSTTEEPAVVDAKG